MKKKFIKIAFVLCTSAFSLVASADIKEKVKNAIQQYRCSLDNPGEKENVEKSLAHLICTLKEVRNKPHGLGEGKHTALHFAVLTNHEDVVRNVIKHGSIDCYAVDLNGKTALHMAVENGNLEICKILLACEGSYDTIFLCGLFGGVPKCIGHTVSNLFKTSAVKRRDSNGCTPLHRATKLKNVEICELLAKAKKRALKSGDKPGCDSYCSSDGFTAFDYALETGNSELYNTYKKYGAEVTQKSIEKAVLSENPASLLYALRELKENLINKLLMSNNMPLIIYVASHGRPDALEELLRRGNVDLKKTDIEGNTPLHHAVRARDVASCQILINKDPGLIDTENSTKKSPDSIVKDELLDRGHLSDGEKKSLKDIEKIFENVTCSTCYKRETGIKCCPACLVKSCDVCWAKSMNLDYSGRLRLAQCPDCRQTINSRLDKKRELGIPDSDIDEDLEAYPFSVHELEREMR